MFVLFVPHFVFYPLVIQFLLICLSTESTEVGVRLILFQPTHSDVMAYELNNLDLNTKPCPTAGSICINISPDDRSVSKGPSEVWKAICRLGSDLYLDFYPFGYLFREEYSGRLCCCCLTDLR
ncbi:hypothetical protein AVEN_172319-1 [Araneus ventricosus]|uniref:Uncharacterized protein n=1 Tax=Araneus ventricosus TaxID=182803 RepID=A0A4Y2E3V0_ARAVE|nr:hypothetical protein AVEN_172319-1 [Araneus ventricosus]